MNNEVAQHWNSLGEKYSSSWKGVGKEWMNNQEKDFIMKGIGYAGDPVNKQVLDVGSGTGRIQEIIKSFGYSDILGVDISQEMISFLSKKFSDSTVSFKRIDSIREVSGNYDLITAIRVLKYSDTWKDDLKHLMTLLKPGGIFVFTMPNENSVTRFAPYPIKKYKTNLKELYGIISSEGFEILEICTKFRLPDFLYEFKFETMQKLVILIEKVMNKILPDVLLGKIFYVTVKKH